jgi:hypothetical protein
MRIGFLRGCLAPARWLAQLARDAQERHWEQAFDRLGRGEAMRPRSSPRADHRR